MPAGLLHTPDPVLIQPETAEAVADALKRASDARRSVVIRGAGTKAGWGRPAAAIDVVLETGRLNRVLTHEHGDLTATVEAGATLRVVNETLARHRQWLPLDPPFADRATIGGILATNDSGPLRHRFGTPRDLIIGVRLATTDGVLSKAGGQVVKNVAGYDLSKLVTGSFGSLAAIVSATFKLSPLPAASKTLRIVLPDATAVAHAVRTIMASPVEPLVFEVETRRRSQPPSGPFGTGSDFTLLVQFASLPIVVDAQIETTLRLPPVARCPTMVLDGDAEQAFWRGYTASVWDAPGAVVRASWLPANIALVLDELDATAAQKGCLTTVVARAAVGAGLIRIDGDDDAQVRAVERLRQSPYIGNIVIVRGSAGLKARADVWGPMGDRQRLLESMKHAFDPNGVLNAGRGPL